MFSDQLEYDPSKGPQTGVESGRRRRRGGGGRGDRHEHFGFLVFSSFFVGILGQNHSTRPVILNRSQPPPTTPIPFYNIFT